MSHTPGPWQMNIFPSGTVSVLMRVASGKGVAIFGPDHSYQDGHLSATVELYNVPAFQALTGESHDKLTEERIANGHLIAAAPELLEALKQMIRVFQTHRDGNILEMTTVRVANTAIAKAEGKV